MLARMDGKSPLEYFADEGLREVVRTLARAALLREDTTIATVIAAVEERLA